MVLLSLLSYVFIQTFGLLIAFVAALVLLYMLLRRFHSRMATALLCVVFLGISLFFYVPNGLPRGFEYMAFLKTYGPSEGPVLPFQNVLHFFFAFNRFEKVADIVRDPNDIPSPITRTEPTVVSISIEAKEVIAEIAPGVTMNYWTFDGKVPGPFLRVREGDTVRLTLHNSATSLHHHSIDLHAVTGPGGGAAATIVAPGESKTITFKALHPGLFIYHCAHPNVATHMAHGMYGLILVEPKEGLPHVDREYYVMQGEFYTTGTLGKQGLQMFDAAKMLDGIPQYVVFNGRTSALAKNLQAHTGETVRMYIGNGGVNLISNFHVIGEVFNRVYREGDLTSAPAQDIQTTLIPAGGAAAVEFNLNVPGNYVLVDHALARMDRGAWGVLHVEGQENKEIFDGVVQSGHGH